MIDKGMDNAKQVLKVDIFDKRIADIDQVRSQL
jgi:hypothetical protein